MELMPGFTVDSQKVLLIMRAATINKDGVWKMDAKATHVLAEATERKRYLRLSGMKTVRTLIQLDASCEFMTFGSPKSYEWVKGQKDREDMKLAGVRT